MNPELFVFGMVALAVPVCVILLLLFVPDMKQRPKTQPAQETPVAKPQTTPKTPRFSTKASRICLLLSPLGMTVTICLACIYRQYEFSHTNAVSVNWLKYWLLDYGQSEHFLRVASRVGVAWTACFVLFAFYYEQTLLLIIRLVNSAALSVTAWVRAGK